MKRQGRIPRPLDTNEKLLVEEFLSNHKSYDEFAEENGITKPQLRYKVKKYKEEAKNMKLFNWINDNVKIDFTVSKLLANTMAEAEEADLNKKNGEYMAISDMIDVLAKNDYSSGKLTKDQWDKICQRYPYI